MKILFIWLLASLAAPTSNPSPVAEPSILGKWSAPDIENAIINVYKAKDGLIYGKIISCDKEDWVGETILKEARYDSQSKSWKGEVYSLRMFFTVDVEMSLEPKEKLKIVGTRFFMTKTFYWERVKE